VSVTLTPQYPFISPLVQFLTPIYHPCIQRNGYFYLEMLCYDHWFPGYTINDVLEQVHHFLRDPMGEEPLLANNTNETDSSTTATSTTATSTTTDDSTTMKKKRAYVIPKQPREPYDGNMAQQYQTNREEFNAKARESTKLHAHSDQPFAFKITW
jgi:ubiquitin-protein ligase